MQTFANLSVVSKSWNRNMQKVRTYFQNKWLTWYHSCSFDGTCDETYQGYHPEYKHGKYLKFKDKDIDEEFYLREEGEFRHNLPTVDRVY